MAIAAMPWALARNQSGASTSVARPTVRSTRCTHTAAVPRALRGCLVPVRRYIHHDAARDTARAMTTAQTFGMADWSPMVRSARPQSSTGRDVGTIATMNARMPARFSSASSVSLLPL